MIEKRMKKKHSTIAKRMKKKHSTKKMNWRFDVFSNKPIMCPDYKRFGVCKNRYADNMCEFLHPQIHTSRTLLLYDIYLRPNPYVSHPRVIEDHFQIFYENLYAKLSKYGEIKDLIVCDYVSECFHMAGHAFVQYRTKKQASAALHDLHGTFHDGVPIVVELSPVRHLRRYLCSAYEKDNACIMTGSECDFVHRKKTRREIRSLADVTSSSPSVHGSDPESCITE